jgi:hypothetical protein
MWNNFKMWRDLISGNYENYNLLPEDDPYEECYNWFWTSINLDETYPKEFLEYLQQLMRDIDSGKVEGLSYGKCNGGTETMDGKPRR